MTLVSCVHHVEIHVKYLRTVVQQLCTRLDFFPIAVHDKGWLHGLLVSNGRAKLLVRQLGSPTLAQENTGLPGIGTSCCKDKVVGVALESENLEAFKLHVKCQSLAEMQHFTESHLQAVSMQSPISAHLHHTVIQKDTKSDFLPNFTPINHGKYVENDKNTYIDHVAIACRPKQSNRLILWYQKIFGLSRFKVNSAETEDGFIVKHKGTGMNLKAVSSDVSVGSGVKFVFAEPLNNNWNQINTFLDQYGGPGVQHVAIHIDEFLQSISRYRNRGMVFMDPPSAYYKHEIGSLDKVLTINTDVHLFRKNGILVDTEADCLSGGRTHLMQVFTRPILHEQTFFLEFIHRCGATGFGAGNISALWRSIEANAIQDAD